MEDFAVILGIIGLFGGIGAVIYFTISNKELLDELENQDKFIKKLTSEHTI